MLKTRTKSDHFRGKFFFLFFSRSFCIAQRFEIMRGINKWALRMGLREGGKKNVRGEISFILIYSTDSLISFGMPQYFIPQNTNRLRSRHNEAINCYPLSWTQHIIKVIKGASILTCQWSHRVHKRRQRELPRLPSFFILCYKITINEWYCCELFFFFNKSF